MAVDSIRPVRPNAKASTEQVVERKFSEMVQKSAAEAIFEPFFRTKAITDEIELGQTIPEMQKWSLYFEKHGCLICETKDRSHSANGMCHVCYIRTRGRLRDLLQQAEIRKEIRIAAASGDVIETETKRHVGERHAQWCTICSHPKRRAIEQDYVKAGRSFGAIRAIMRKYGLKGTWGLYKHARVLGLNPLRNLGTE